MSQWTNGNHWEQINKLIKETIVCCVKFKRFLMWILHVWNLQWINVYSNQTKGFCFYQWNRKGKWLLPWMRLAVVYLIITSNKWTLRCFEKDTEKTSQELCMLSRSLSDCKSLLINVMIQVVQFNCSQFTYSLHRSQSTSKSKSLSLQSL